jgi:hypothetical protein
MKTLSILLLTGLLHGAPLQADQAHHHHAADDDVISMLVLNDGAKWPVDTVLSEVMLRLRAQLLTHLDDIHHKRFTASQYQQFSQVLQQETNHIVANCKLTPEADAQFHLVLAAMMQSQQAMAASELATQRQGAVRLLRTLQRYPEYFNDDAFLPITH